MSDRVAYSEEAVRHWLGFLARNMQSRGQTIFLVENLQPTWLGDTKGRRMYFGMTRSVLPFLLALVLYVAMKVFLLVRKERLVRGELLLCCVGCMVACMLSRLALETVLKRRSAATDQAVEAPWRLRDLFTVTMAFLAQMLVLVLAVIAPAAAVYHNAGGDFPLALFCAFIPIALMNITAAFDRGRRSLEEDIQPVERLTWSWKTFRRELHSRVVFWTFVTVAAFGIWARDALGTAALVAVACVSLLARAINRGFEAVAVPMKTRPNSGIWLSLRISAVFVGLTFAITGILVYLVSPSKEESGFRFAAGVLLKYAMCLFLPAAIWRAPMMGGMAFGYHFALRFLLAVRGDAPFHYVRFLDYAANQLGFLQKVGGGYTFMHRYLLEYFAGQSGDQVESARRTDAAARTA